MPVVGPDEPRGVFDFLQRDHVGLLGGDQLDPSGSIHVGARQDLDSTRFLRGEVDDVMLQARHLSRPEIEELFASSLGYARTYGQGCKTSQGAVPVHGVQGSPALGALVFYEVTRAAPARSGLLFFGFSRSSIGGTALPLDLKLLGAPSCPLLQDAVLSAAIGITQGKGALRLTIPTDPTLRGLRFYSQVMVLDQNANAAGFAVSDGLISTLGG